ncbi:hypothetical protein BZA70DRAFT_289257 [Myxozyma melibiosi]|uniref:Uncharacterized protein n=1 Tax=Myxozyma melibiosi TaxID=54550 RepID=A0ABR1F878_9ASCO
MASATSSPSWMDTKRVEAVEKVVLQRAKISRITRQLQNRLAFASYKTKRGWENLDLDQIEPRIALEVEARRRRARSLSDRGSVHSSSSPSSSYNSLPSSSSAATTVTAAAAAQNAYPMRPPGSADSNSSDASSSAGPVYTLPPQSFVPSSFSSPIKPSPQQLFLPAPNLSHQQQQQQQQPPVYQLPALPRRHHSKSVSATSTSAPYGLPIDHKRTRTLSSDKQFGPVSNYTAWRPGSRRNDDDDEIDVDHDLLDDENEHDLFMSSTGSPSYAAGLRLNQSSPLYPGKGRGSRFDAPPPSSIHNQSPQHYSNLHEPLQRQQKHQQQRQQPLQRMGNGSPLKKHSRQSSASTGVTKQHRRNKSSVASTTSTMSNMSSNENRNSAQFTHSPAPSAQGSHHTSKSKAKAQQQQQEQQQRHASPPRTPPPRKFDRPFNGYASSASSSRTGEEGADLLMYLATSPSPAQRFSFASNFVPGSNQQQPPSSILSTPPPQNRSAPSWTPVLGSNGMSNNHNNSNNNSNNNGNTSGSSNNSSNNGPQTPSQGFNFSDYVNIFTPSPAQVQWHARTPIITPARKRLNFDHPDGIVTIQTTSSADHPAANGNSARSSFKGGSGGGSVMEVGGSLIP